MHLSDAQWEVIKALLREKRRADGGGRPWRDARAVLDAVLWILRTGVRWQHLPREYPPYQTCHRRFQQWVREGLLERILRALAEDCYCAEPSIWRKPSSVLPSAVPKKGRLCWSYAPRKRDQDHGNCGPPWSSFRPLD